MAKPQKNRYDESDKFHDSDRHGQVEIYVDNRRHQRLLRFVNICHASNYQKVNIHKTKDCPGVYP